MRTILLSVFMLFNLLSAAAPKENREVEFDSLPYPAKFLITNYFDDYTIITIQEDHKNYCVAMNNSTVLRFKKDGEWVKIDCNKLRIPSPIIDSRILNGVAAKYGPKNKIVKIEKRRSKVKVKLDNGVEMTFDRDLKVID